MQYFGNKEGLFAAAARWTDEHERSWRRPRGQSCRGRARRHVRAASRTPTTARRPSRCMRNCLTHPEAAPRSCATRSCATARRPSPRTIGGDDAELRAGAVRRLHDRARHGPLPAGAAEPVARRLPRGRRSASWSRCCARWSTRRPDRLGGRGQADSQSTRATTTRASTRARASTTATLAQPPARAGPPVTRHSLVAVRATVPDSMPVPAAAAVRPTDGRGGRDGGSGLGRTARG